jgi:hypothetical protein
MSTNVDTRPSETPSLENQHKHLHEVHQHLQHASTADSPEEIRERMRRAELALQRHEAQKNGA